MGSHEEFRKLNSAGNTRERLKVVDSSKFKNDDGAAEEVISSGVVSVGLKGVHVRARRSSWLRLWDIPVWWGHVLQLCPGRLGLPPV